MKRKWWIACVLALLALLVAGTALAADDGVRQLECEICGTKTLFDRIYYKAEDKLYINGQTGHIGYFQCRECKHITSNISDFIAHSGGTATCTERAKCEVCGASYGDYAHVFKDIEPKEPTCTEKGWKDGKTCINCGYTTRTYIDKRNHAMSIATTQAPTCTEKGWKESHCLYEDCDYVYRTDIPALEHDLALLDTKEPTCTEKGWNDFACQREGCNYTTRVYIDALDHDLAHHDAKAATCTEIGWDAYETCKRCDYTTYKQIDALDHKLALSDTKEPTCTEKGWKDYACQREGCDYTTRVYIDALEHDYVKHDAKAATCTEIGWDAYETCKRCDYTTYKQIDALEHDLVHRDAKAATCTEIGWDAYDACSRCDYTTYAELPALGHDYEARVIEPTCTKTGYTLHACTRCGDHYSDGRTEKLYHWFGEWTPDADETQSAACLRDGCGETGHAACTRFTFLLKLEGDENAYELSLCPICGRISDDLRLTLLENVTALTVNEHSLLPAGELTVRMGMLENGETVMSLCFEQDGQITQPDGELRITVPSEALTGYGLARVNPDGTETRLTVEMDDENATFVLDFTDAPVQLIHLVPAV